MMKREINNTIAIVAVAALALAGCSQFQEDDFFEESASLRVQHFNEDLRSRLISQSSDDNNGWVIQYFVSSSFEGFNLFGRFQDNGKVTLASDHRYLRNGNANKYTEASSFYEFLAEEGPVLAFNTWNDVLTVFVDPVDPQYAPATLMSNGEGMSGDQNLVFRGFEGDNILFQGQRHSSKVRFVPCDRSWQDYINDTKATRDYISNGTISSYYVICGADTLFFKNLRNGVITYCERINEPLFPSSINCVFTPNGFYLQNKNEIKGTSFQEFSLTDDKTCLMSENDSVKVMATWDSYIVNTRTTTWNFDQEGFSDEQKNLLSQINTALQGAFNSTFNINSVGMGRGKNVASAIAAPIMYFNYSYVSKGKTSKSSLGISCSMSAPSYGKVKIVFASDAAIDSNMKNFFDRSKNVDVEALVRQFAATFQGTYDIVPDDYFLPTGCELRAVDGSHSYTLN